MTDLVDLCSFLSGKHEIVKSALYIHDALEVLADHLLIKAQGVVFFPHAWTQSHDFAICYNCGLKHYRKPRATN